MIQGGASNDLSLGPPLKDLTFLSQLLWKSNSNERLGDTLTPYPNHAGGDPETHFIDENFVKCSNNAPKSWALNLCCLTQKLVTLTVSL
jgi:hypothetical protein